MSVGDVGHLDNDGFLYVTDRVSDLIISGGVNIYPREVEMVLINHPAVADVAVIGVPDSDMGEAVKAIVEPSRGCEPSQELGAELIEYARSRIAHFKCPRTVDFVREMPRLPTGKIQKRVLRSAFCDGPEVSLC
jgi:acyl-CoA synthetase (AMP-forming)/AMP-acid ligase II